MIRIILSLFKVSTLSMASTSASIKKDDKYIINAYI